MYIVNCVKIRFYSESLEITVVSSRALDKISVQGALTGKDGASYKNFYFK